MAICSFNSHMAASGREVVAPPARVRPDTASEMRVCMLSLNPIVPAAHPGLIEDAKDDDKLKARMKETNDLVLRMMGKAPTAARAPVAPLSIPATPTAAAPIATPVPVSPVVAVKA